MKIKDQIGGIAVEIRFDPTTDAGSLVLDGQLKITLGTAGTYEMFMGTVLHEVLEGICVIKHLRLIDPDLLYTQTQDMYFLLAHKDFGAITDLCGAFLARNHMALKRGFHNKGSK